MITLVKNELEGQFAAPKDHPITSINPSPWKIIEVRIDVRGLGKVVVMIRGEHSCWFPVSNCLIGPENELKDWVEYKEEKSRIRQLLRPRVCTFGDEHLDLT